jgi:hypothetical protein
MFGAWKSAVTTYYLSSFLSWAARSLVDLNRPRLSLRLSILGSDSLAVSRRSVRIFGRAPHPSDRGPPKWGGDKIGVTQKT